MESIICILGVVFAIEIKRHEVSNHSATAMLLLNNSLYMWFPDVR